MMSQITRLFTPFLIILLSSVNFSCEEVVKLNLNNAEPVLVIEGLIIDGPGPYTVSLTKTTDFYEPNEYPTVSNAIVTISDDAGNSETLQEIEPGLYETSTIAGISGRTYSLTVSTEGVEYTAVSTMPEPLVPDSVGYKFTEFFGIDGYEIICYFQDRENINDYCRLKFRLNDHPVEEYFLYEDRLTDGEPIDYGIWLDDVNINDEVVIVFYTFESPMYEYYASLSPVVVYSNHEGDGSSDTMSQPGNPISNITGGALGYFGAVTKQRFIITIQ
jgi:hypothetical protein